MSGVYSRRRVREWRVKQDCGHPTEDSAASSHEQEDGCAVSSGKRVFLTTEPRSCSGVTLRNSKRPRLVQTCIDAGQRSLDWTVCRKCGMGYVGGSPEDIAQHKSECRRRARASFLPPQLSFSSWRDDYNYPADGLLRSLRDGGRIIGVGCAFPRNFRRAKELDDFVCSELGVLDDSLGGKLGRWLALMRLDDAASRVTGYVLAQVVYRGHLARIDDDGTAVLLNGTPPLSRRMLGVRRVWVDEKYRRKAVASCLIDTARSHIIPGEVISPCDVAFTTPTQSGAYFAAAYRIRHVGDKAFSALKASAGVATSKAPDKQIIVYKEECSSTEADHL